MPTKKVLMEPFHPEDDPETLFFKMGVGITCQDQFLGLVVVDQQMVLSEQCFHLIFCSSPRAHFMSFWRGE